MEGQLTTAFNLVQQPNNQMIKEGEHLLARLKKDNQYPLALIHYINNSNTDHNFKLRAAIELKLWCQFYKDLQEFQRKFYDIHMNEVKQQLLMAYLTFPLKISKTLRPGIVSLADAIFPNYWNDLISNLISYARQNPQSTIATLKMIQSISHKYSYESRSDPLYEEITLVCNQTHDFILDLTVALLERIGDGREDDIVMLRVLMQVFYNLNFQDLHPSFQDHIPQWMTILKTIMNFKNTNELIFKCKGAALEAILLYASKYKEDVEASIKDFCSEIWQLCSNASEDPQYDSIVFSCLKFFKSLVMWPDMKAFFLENMGQLFKNLILPNIGITKTLIGLFEDEVQLYIDYYFRNTQILTRRAAAIQLLRVICRHYDVIEPFLQQQLQNYTGTNQNVPAECTLLSLVIDGSSKGFRDVDGCTQLFVNQNIITYTYQQIVKKTLFGIYEWMGKNPSGNIESQFNPIHISTIIRFLFFFRIYIPKEELSSILQFLTSIKSDNNSLRKVIYLSINGFLVMRHGDFVYFKNLVYYFRGENLKGNAVDILKVIYQGTSKSHPLQESLTKMIYNLTKGLGTLNQHFFDYQIEIYKEMLKKTKVYDFNSVVYLFESMGEVSYQLISCRCTQRTVLEKTVMDFFMQSLKTKSDLMNFCLQILSIYLMLQDSTNNQYKAIYDSLLMEQNWKEENQSLMSSYIQFLTAYMAKHKERLIEDKAAIDNILSQIIKIEHFQLFYRFMEAIITNITLSEFYQSGYMSLLLQAGEVTAHTIPGRKASLLFICKMLSHYDTMQTLKLINQCFQNYFDQLITASPDILRTLSQRIDRKYLFNSLCKAIRLNYFRDMNLLVLVLDSLIVNTAQRFNIRNISSQLQESQAKEKKESTYKKLMVFKEFEKQAKDIDINEEKQILEAFKYVNSMNDQIVNLIDQKSRERLIRMNDKYQG